jgi:hypothetical protein
MKRIFTLSYVLINFFTLAQFPPPAGQPGSTAIYKDSSVFIAWATGCEVTRGFQDISNPALGYTTSGNDTMALGKAGENGVVSLGDGGYAILTFKKPIKNETGWDFAVFENAFNDEFLELAFVEVSSDGTNYFRFPATSFTQNKIQIDGFGSLDARKIDNLAGKYRVLYGTPFDLEELSSQPDLDINKINYVKIIDVVGCIQPIYATYDRYNNIINDPWNTPFPSGGFDLDAVGVIHQENSGDINELNKIITQFDIFPNPMKNISEIKYYLSESLEIKIIISDILGNKKLILPDRSEKMGLHFVNLTTQNFEKGIYFLELITPKGSLVKKIVIENE